MTIKIEELADDDVGRYVLYATDDPHRTTEKGRIKSWNDKYVFVVYSCGGEWERFQDFTAEATRPEDLIFLDEVESQVFATCKLDYSGCVHEFTEYNDPYRDYCTKCGQSFWAFAFMEAP